MAVLLAFLVLSGAAVTSFADDISEAEPNNDKENATAYDVNGVITGSLTDAEDIDWYSVTLKNYGTAHITLTQTGSDVFETAVFDSSDSELTSFTVSEQSGKSPVFTVTPGEYYIVVKSGSVASGAEYKIEFTNIIAEYSEVESNNTKDTANIINLKSADNSGEAVGSVTGDDEDWFAFTALNGYFYCQLKRTDDGSGTVSAEIIKPGSKDSRVGVVSVSQSGKAEKSADVGSVAGKYYVKVTGEGVYTLTVSAFKSDIATEIESNNTTETASPYTINYSDITVGSLYDADDVDWYIVTTSEKDKNSIVVFDAMNTASYAGFDPNSSWKIEFYNSDKELISSAVASVGSPAEFNLANEGAGTYYFKVSSDLNPTLALYYISSKETDPPEETGSFWQQIINMLKGSKAWDQAKELWGNINPFGVMMYFVEHIIVWILTIFKNA